MKAAILKETGLIYVATHVDSGKIYVGQTSQDLRFRVADHLKPTTRTYFSNVLRKYGIEQFNFRLIPCKIEDLNEIECLLIAALNSRRPNGFNLTDGGGGMRGWHPSEESRRKNAEAHRGRIPSAEAREKYRAARLGKTMPEETRKKISMTNMGHTVSETTRRAVSQANRLRVMPEGNKRKLLEANIAHHKHPGLEGAC